MEFTEDKKFCYAVEVTLEAEGIFSDDPQDSGGATIYGVSSKWYPEAYKCICNAPSVTEAIRCTKEFYHIEFWLRLQCDKLDSKHIATEVFDTAVNVGKKYAVKFLQEAVNRLGTNLNIKLLEDGIIGVQTLMATNKLCITYELSLLLALNVIQGMYYFKLQSDSPEYAERFIRGWMKRLVIPKELL